MQHILKQENSVSDHQNFRLVSKIWRESVDAFNGAMTIDHSLTRDMKLEDQFYWGAVIEVPLTKAQCEWLKEYGKHGQRKFIGRRASLQYRDATTISMCDQVTEWDLVKITDAVEATKHLWESLDYLEVTDDGTFETFGMEFDGKYMELVEPLLTRLTSVTRVVLRSSCCAKTVERLPHLEKLKEIVHSLDQNYDENCAKPDWNKVLGKCHLNLALLHVAEVSDCLSSALLELNFPYLEEFSQGDSYPENVFSLKVMPKLKILGVVCRSVADWCSLINFTNRHELLMHVAVECPDDGDKNVCFALEQHVSANPQKNDALKVMVIDGKIMPNCLVAVLKKIYPFANVSFM